MFLFGSIYFIIDIGDLSKNQTSFSLQNNSSYNNNKLVVHFIDVGQGDSILIQSPHNKTMLIDAGDTIYGEKVLDYLDLQGITKIDLLVATHPHADHIGGMVDVNTP